MMLRYFLLTLVLSHTALAQQVPDLEFKADVGPAAYRQGQGPVVLIDAGHYNFHTADGRFGSFAGLIERDGYRVTSASKAFTASLLEDVDVLVIANALAEQNELNWSLPAYPAFTDEEVEVVRTWVEEGGALLLIADHMPMGGAAANLARPFGAEFENSYAFVPDRKPGEPDLFTVEANTLKVHSITKGRGEEERVTTVATFTGQAFSTSDDLTPIIVFEEGTESMYPERSWEIDDATRRKDVGGWAHAAVRTYGRGRVALFGEAAMFTAQLADAARRPMGMNHKDAAQNGQYVLNVLHWLSGLLDEPEE